MVHGIKNFFEFFYCLCQVLQVNPFITTLAPFYRRTYALSFGFKMKPLRNMVYSVLREKPTQILIMIIMLNNINNNNNNNNNNRKLSALILKNVLIWYM